MGGSCVPIVGVNAAEGAAPVRNLCIHGRAATVVSAMPLMAHRYRRSSRPRRKHAEGGAVPGAAFASLKLFNLSAR
jgi:hypothetical protein